MVIDPSKLSSEVANKYTLANNALKMVAKEDPHDKIEIEVGDIKQPDAFYPQVKIMRWDNEVNFSARLVSESLDAEYPTLSVQEPEVSTDTNIVYKSGNTESHFYEIELCEEYPEGGYEFEVILKEKPKTNVVTFTLQTKGLDFFYQPELTKEEVESGAKRPEDVVGSYAIYASEEKINYVGGKEYKSGKVGHIYRPKIIDMGGTKVWGDLNIDGGAGLLTVTIPQEFLDKAIYPVRHAAGLTFGYTTLATATITSIEDQIAGSVFTGVAGTGTSITFGAKQDTQAGSGTTKCGIYNASTLAFITNSKCTGTVSYTSTATWRTIDFDSPPTLTAVNYILVAWSTILGGGGPIPGISYDTGATNQGQVKVASMATNFPNPLVTPTQSTKRHSIYVTYTAGGDTTVKDMLGGIIPFAR